MSNIGTWVVRAEPKDAEALRDLVEGAMRIDNNKNTQYVFNKEVYFAISPEGGRVVSVYTVDQKTLNMSRTEYLATREFLRMLDDRVCQRMSV